MEDDSVELKRARRRRHTQNAINKQKRIAKTSMWNHSHADQPHRWAKHHALDCGQSRCVVCGNPRKIWKQRTLQEKRALQNEIDYY